MQGFHGRRPRKGLPATLHCPAPFLVPTQETARHIMTVGIGVACHGGSCVVLAADGKGSFKGEPSLSHERLGKQHALPLGLYSNLAGTVKICNSFVNRLASALEGHPQNDPIRLDELLEIVESARYAELKARLNIEMKKHLQMTIKQWQDLPSASPRYRRGRRLNSRYWLPVEFLIGGIIRGSGCLVYFTPDEDAANEESLVCIGTGGNAAYRWLMKRNQEVHMSLPRTLLHVAEAMREARLKNRKTVGEPADYVVITATQTRRMPAKDPTLQQMLASYAGRDTKEIDSSDELHRAVQSAMYLPKAAAFKTKKER